MSTVDDLYRKINATAQFPDTVPSPLKRDSMRTPMRKKPPAGTDMKRVRWVEWQEGVILQLNAIRRLEAKQIQLLERLIERDEKDDVLGEGPFETNILLPSNKPVLQLDFLAGEHTNLDPTINLVGNDVQIPYCPVKSVILYNKSVDQVVKFYINPRYQNLQRVSGTIDPGDVAGPVSSRKGKGPNIARINLLNGTNTGTAIVKVWALV